MAITTQSAAPGNASRPARLAGELLDILREEYVALESGDVVALSQTTQAKDRALTALRQSVAQSPLPRDAVLAALLREAAQANADNTQFAATRLAYTRARLGGLTQAAQLARAAVQSGALYRADGFTGGRGLHGSLFGLA
jgi:uncharacterized membrane protein